MTTTAENSLPKARNTPSPYGAPVSSVDAGELDFARLRSAFAAMSCTNVALVGFGLIAQYPAEAPMLHLRVHKDAPGSWIAAPVEATVLVGPTASTPAMRAFRHYLNPPVSTTLLTVRDRPMPGQRRPNEMAEETLFDDAGNEEPLAEFAITLRITSIEEGRPVIIAPSDDW